MEPDEVARGGDEKSAAVVEAPAAGAKETVAAMTGAVDRRERQRTSCRDERVRTNLCSRWRREDQDEGGDRRGWSSGCTTGSGQEEVREVRKEQRTHSVTASSRSKRAEKKRKRRKVN
jgi:hypothetical protein